MDSRGAELWSTCRSKAASGFLSAPGWTGGAGVELFLGPRITVRGGADVDLGAGELVAALGSLELHGRCNCVVVRATATHRIGRDGIDAWVSVDLSDPEALSGTRPLACQSLTVFWWAS